MRLLIRAFGIPFSYLIAAHLFMYSAEAIAASKYLYPLAPYIRYVSGGLWLLAAGMGIYNCARILRAGFGKDANACPRCSMPTSRFAAGKYGPYFHCWGCGENTAERY